MSAPPEDDDRALPPPHDRDGDWPDLETVVTVRCNPRDCVWRYRKGFNTAASA